MLAQAHYSQDTIGQYRQENTLPSVLSRIHGADMTPRKIKEDVDYIGSKIGSCVLQELVKDGRGTRVRWRLAQFLSVLLRVSSAARARVLEMSEWCVPICCLVTC
jgi:hypothetical protein